MMNNKISDGQLIMISSMSGHRVPPNPSTRFYSATKFAVTGLLEGWRQEVRDLGSNIRVSAISPGQAEPPQRLPVRARQRPAEPGMARQGPA